MKTEQTDPKADTETARSEEPASIESGAAPAAERVPHPSAAIVDDWFAKHFHNMSSLFDERATAHLLGAKEDLKATLSAL
jgi:hypothetical protein